MPVLCLTLPVKISFSCFITLWIIVCIIDSNYGENRHPFLVPDYNVKAVVSVKNPVSIGFW